MFRLYNPNPMASRVGDCAVRAVSKALGQDWIKTYIGLCLYGLLRCDMPSANHVWGSYLKDRGFDRYVVPDNCYTVDDFLCDHNRGVYVIGTNGHVITAIDGTIFDTWDSSQEVPIYYWHKGV